MESNEEICDSLNDRKTNDSLPCSFNLKEDNSTKDYHIGKYENVRF